MESYFNELTGPTYYVRHPDGTYSAAEPQPLSKKQIEFAYSMGWRRAAIWADRDDLICDIDSPAFERDMAIDLAVQVPI